MDNTTSEADSGGELTEGESEPGLVYAPAPASASASASAAGTAASTSWVGNSSSDGGEGGGGGEEDNTGNLDAGPSGILVGSDGIDGVGGGDGDAVLIDKHSSQPAPYAAALAAALAGNYAAPSAAAELQAMWEAVAEAESGEGGGRPTSASGGGSYQGSARTGSRGGGGGASRDRQRYVAGPSSISGRPRSPGGGMATYATESPRSAYTFPRGAVSVAAAGGGRSPRGGSASPPRGRTGSPSATGADLRAMAMAEEAKAAASPAAARAAAMAAAVAGATVGQKSETGVPGAHFAGQLRSGRGLGMPAPRPPWPRPLKTQGASVAGTHSAVPLDADTLARETERYLHRIVTRHTASEAAASEALERALQAQAAAKEAAGNRSLEAYEAEVAAGRALLDELTATHLAPHAARHEARSRALHASWTSAVYAPLRADLEAAITSKFGVVSPDIVTASVLSSAVPPSRATRGVGGAPALPAAAAPLPARTREAVDARDPTRAPLRRVANDEAVVGNTAYVGELRRLGALVAPDGSYVMPAHVGSVSKRATAHALAHPVAAAAGTSGGATPVTVTTAGSATAWASMLPPSTGGGARSIRAASSSVTSEDAAWMARSPSALALAEVADRMRAVQVGTAPGFPASAGGSGSTVRGGSGGGPRTHRARVLAAAATARSSGGSSSPRRGDVGPPLASQLAAVAAPVEALTSLSATVPPAVRMGIATYALDGSLPLRASTMTGAAEASGSPRAEGGGGAGSSPLYSVDGTRQLLRAGVWGTGVIESTTYAHTWQLAGDGLLAPTHPEVVAYARAGEVAYGAARHRMQGDPEVALSPTELSATLLTESSGYGPGYRGKRRVPVAARARRDADAAPRGRRRDGGEEAPTLATSEVARALHPTHPLSVAHPPRVDRPGVRHVAMGAAAQPDHVAEAMDALVKLHAGAPPRRHDVIGMHVPVGEFMRTRPDDGSAVLIPPRAPPRTDVAGRPSWIGERGAVELAWATE